MSVTRNRDWYLSRHDRDVREAQVEGFNMAILAAHVVLNDYFDFADEELKEFDEGCKKVVAAVSDGQESALAINRRLKEMTGNDILREGREKR